MKNLSLKLDDDVFQETEQILAELKETRNRYINKALSHFNKLHRDKRLRKQYERESLIVREESMRVLHEFEQLDDEATKI